jgi:tRNA/rRNA methyltransferase
LLTRTELDRLVVVLVGTRNPLNIGAAARAMSNFGFPHLRVVNVYQPAFREARSAVGASALLKAAEHFTKLGDAVADCTLVVGTTAGRREFQQPLRRLEDGARLIARAAAGVTRGRASSGRVALLFGSEKFGISNRDLSHCHWLMRIPTVDANISMNVGQAVAVCLYELARDAKAPRLPEKLAPAASVEVERITQSLLYVLHASGFLGRRQIKTAEERIRRLVRRIQIPARDTDAWLGMLRQITWKIDRGSSLGSGPDPGPDPSPGQK